MRKEERGAVNEGLEELLLANPPYFLSFSLSLSLLSPSRSSYLRDSSLPKLLDSRRSGTAEQSTGTIYLPVGWEEGEERGKARFYRIHVELHSNHVNGNIEIQTNLHFVPPSFIPS